MLPKDIVLETSKVILRPIVESDFGPFLALAKQDPPMWYYFTLNLGDESHLQKWMEVAFSDKKAGTRLPFTIIDKASGNIAGSSSLGNISLHDLRGEIGWSWLGKDYRSSGINKHAKFSLMRFGFEELHFERIEFKTDVENERAKKGLRNVGGIEEGVLRSHMTMWNNRRRSSIYYSVLKNEWPVNKQTIFKDIP